MNRTASIDKAILQLIGCCFFMLIIFGSASAQTRGKVEVIKDQRIDTLAARRAELNRTLGIETISGFRVQIFTGSNRKDAYSAQTKFQQEFPDIRTYVIYNDPNFKVRVGDFRTKDEAEKLQNDLKKWFNGMFIIQDKINPPKAETTDE